MAQESYASISIDTEHSLLTQDSIMRQHAECKKENKERLR